MKCCLMFRCHSIDCLGILGISCKATAVLRHLLRKKNEPDLSLHFLVNTHVGQCQVYNKRMIRGNATSVSGYILEIVNFQ